MKSRTNQPIDEQSVKEFVNEQINDGSILTRKCVNLGDDTPIAIPASGSYTAITLDSSITWELLQEENVYIKAFLNDNSSLEMERAQVEENYITFAKDIGQDHYHILFNLNGSSVSGALYYNELALNGSSSGTKYLHDITLISSSFSGHGVNKPKLIIVNDISSSFTFSTLAQWLYDNGYITRQTGIWVNICDILINTSSNTFRYYDGGYLYSSDGTDIKLYVSTITYTLNNDVTITSSSSGTSNLSMTSLRQDIVTEL